MRGIHLFRCALLGLLGVLLAASLAVAQTGQKPSSSPENDYELVWHSIAGGGTSLAHGGNYTLGGTIGQPYAGTIAGGVYTLDGGFWIGRVPALMGYSRYVPLVLRSR
jgi:hypothetical protein